MRKLFLLVSVLSLISCIRVDDLGACWDKAGLDKQLLGDWKQVSGNSDQTSDRGYAIGRIIHIKQIGDALEISADDSQISAKDKSEKSEAPSPIYPVKTLDMGPYHFIVTGPKKGFIERYKIQGLTLEFCTQIQLASA